LGIASCILLFVHHVYAFPANLKTVARPFSGHVAHINWFQVLETPQLSLEYWLEECRLRHAQLGLANGVRSEE